MVQSINLNLNNVGAGRKNPPKQINGDFPTPYTMLPEGERNYCLFNQDKVNFIVSQKERAIPYLKQVLQTSDDEKEIVETLYIVDRLCDNGTKGIPAMYPVLARFNDTKSPNIQTFLAGIYRKTQVPDAFGPLVIMLIRNAMSGELNGKWKMENDIILGEERALEVCHCEPCRTKADQMSGFVRGRGTSDVAIQKKPDEAIQKESYSPKENSSPFTVHSSPEEEIGGAILEYIKNYSNNPKAIDYSA